MHAKGMRSDEILGLVSTEPGKPFDTGGTRSDVHTYRMATVKTVLVTGLGCSFSRLVLAMRAGNLTVLKCIYWIHMLPLSRARLPGGTGFLGAEIVKQLLDR